MLIRARAFAAVLPVLSLAGSDAVAHGVEEIEHSPWAPDIGSLLGLAIFALLYGLGWWRMGFRTRERLLGASRGWGFAAGIGVLAVALVSPLDVLAGRLFSAHMLQHLLLMLIAPPLLAWGRPLVVCLWAFPLRVRRGLGSFFGDMPGLRALFHLFTRPLPIGMAASLALWFWHLPGPYRWALHSQPVHIVEHVSFVLTGLAFWTLVAEPDLRRRLGYGTALCFVAIMGMQESLLGALLTFAPRPLYPVSLEDTAAYGLTPLEDQQWAALLMCVPASFVHLVLLSILFFAWFGEAEREARI
jgi:putative membrane protein